LLAGAYVRSWLNFGGELSSGFARTDRLQDVGLGGNDGTCRRSSFGEGGRESLVTPQAGNDGYSGSLAPGSVRGVDQSGILVLGFLLATRTSGFSPRENNGHPGRIDLNLVRGIWNPMTEDVSYRPGEGSARRHPQRGLAKIC